MSSYTCVGNTGLSWPHDNVQHFIGFVPIRSKDLWHYNEIKMGLGGGLTTSVVLDLNRQRHGFASFSSLPFFPPWLRALQILNSIHLSRPNKWSFSGWVGGQPGLPPWRWPRIFTLQGARPVGKLPSFNCSCSPKVGFCFSCFHKSRQQFKRHC